VRITHRQSKWSHRDRVIRVMWCLALWLSLSGGAAQADLVPVNDPVFGRLILDTSTGLEWLSLLRTQGRSADQVLAQLGPGGGLAGFQYGDRNEFVTLFTEVFGTSGLLHQEDSLDLNATINFANLFGPTGSELIPTGYEFGGQRLPTIAGLFGLEGQDVSFIAFGYGLNIDGGGLGGGTDTESVSLEYGDFGVGSFLVRAVPEPPLPLLSVSLMGLAAVMAHRKR
jgi:hypothetical protein